MDYKQGGITRHQAAFHLLSILDKTVRYDTVRSGVRKEIHQRTNFCYYITWEIILRNWKQR